MAAFTWPATLPSRLQIDGFELTLPGGAIRTQMENGPAKQRRRFTGAPQPVSGSVMLTGAQVGIFRDFYVNTLGMGAAAFDWVDPITRTAVEMRFKADSPPKIVNLGGDTYMASLNLEIMP